MARRFHKTTADYVAIAISPALIMTLVGSLVYFLIELFYVGEFQARLHYVFALFVFAAVLIARIAIEMGTERAMLFGLALGIAVFLVLAKFVQHPSPFSHLINGSLIGIVWWCAHRLTWDCTLIDEREDASGEGLMQRIGIDSASVSGPKDDGPKNGGRDARGAQADRLEPDRGHDPGTAENELLATDDGQGLHAWWKRWLGRRGPHPPGMWVLYFSLAALPIFGLGQWLIPTGDTGRRRYLFVLLTVYVASALALLVTTSFLGLRRYLRQRRIEMPAPIAATWIVTGSLLIVVVLLIAILLPRPHAEFAVSQVPWQVRSPAGLTPSRRSLGTTGVQEEEPENSAGDQREEPQQADHAITDNLPNEDQATGDGGQEPRQSGQTTGQESGTQKSSQDPRSQDQDSKGKDSESQGRNQPTPAENAQQHGVHDQPTESSRSPHESKDAPQAQGGSPSQEGQVDARPPQEPQSQESKSEESQSQESQTRTSESRPAQAADHTSERQTPPDTKPFDAKPFDQQQTKEDQPSGSSTPPAAGRPMPPVPHADFSLPVAGIGTLLKFLFYTCIALLIGYLAWKNRRQLLAALVELMGQLRGLLARLLGGKRSADNNATDRPSAAREAAPPTFAQFQDPFLTERSLAPEQLVRYTFEAFEAWARDQGIARRADQTPHELVRLAVPPQTALSSEARRMVRLYNSLAYAGVKVPREQAARLQTLWALMRKTGTGKAESGKRKAEDDRGLV